MKLAVHIAVIILLLFPGPIDAEDLITIRGSFEKVNCCGFADSTNRVVMVKYCGREYS